MEQLSVVIPVYNEQKILVKNTEKLMRFLESKKYKYEIILSDNGSTDNTYPLSKKLEKKHPDKIKAISIQKRGVGAAFRNALKKSSYNKVISLDMDLSTDLGFVPMCLDELKRSSVVIGTKKESQKRPVIRKIISKPYIMMTNLLLGMRFSDYSIGAKGYRKSDIIDFSKYLDDDSFYVVELIHLSNKSGKRISEIAIRCHDNRESKFNLFNEVIYRFRKLLALRMFGTRADNTTNIPITDMN